MSAQGHRCSLAVARGDEEDDAELVRDSPEHDWWRGGGTMEAESGGGSSSARGWRSARENSRMRGKVAGCSRGGASYFVGAGGHRGGGNGW
jgi:hypothetical protein